MKTNFTPQLQRDACYDGGSDGEYSVRTRYPEPTYVDQRSWFEKTINKTPTWVITLIILLGFGVFIYGLILLITFVHGFVSYDVMMWSTLIIGVYSACYFIVKEMRN